MIFNFFPCECPAAPLPLGRYIADCNLSPKICKIVSPRNLQPFSFNLSCIFQTKKKTVANITNVLLLVNYFRIWRILDDILLLMIFPPWCVPLCSSAPQTAELPNVFVQISNVSLPNGKCICPNCKMYLSQLSNVFVQISNVSVPNGKYICPNCQMYLSQLQHEDLPTLQCVSLCPWALQAAERLIKKIAHAGIKSARTGSQIRKYKDE